MWGALIEAARDTWPEGDPEREHDDHARDRDDHAGDRDDHAGDHSEEGAFKPKPGHQYAWNYPDPFTGEPLQIHPSKTLGDFDSVEDFFIHLDALRRYTNYLPPRRRKPDVEKSRPRLPLATRPRSAGRGRSLKSRHVGVRLTDGDFELLDELARAHSVPPGTMARMLIVRAVRAAADAAN